MIAAEHVARAPADGYVVYLASSGVLAFHKHLYARDAGRSVQGSGADHASRRGSGILAVHPSLPAKSVPELVALAKTRPGKINYASAGAGGMAASRCGVLQHRRGHQDGVHVPYKGAAPAVNDCSAARSR
jgi:tripartite-type tricarboxylate transporter receptor subunit TctC